MKNTWVGWQIGGFIFTSILGTFLHFLFDLSGGNIVSALFSAVNESIWEHMKLIFYPMLVFSVAEWYKVSKTKSNFWCVKLMGVLTALLIIPVLYYTYTGILGKSADWFNITIFFIAAGVAYFLEFKLLENNKFCPLSRRLSIAILVTLAIVFTVFTFQPPEIPLFQDPQTGTYGYQKDAAVAGSVFLLQQANSCFFTFFNGASIPDTGLNLADMGTAHHQHT